MAIKITRDVLESYLNCKYKGRVKARILPSRVWAAEASLASMGIVQAWARQG